MDINTGMVGNDAILGGFLQTHPAAIKVSSALRAGAEVGITFRNQPGSWRLVCRENGSTVFEPGPASNPDFELMLPPQAVQNICALADGDVGDLGVAFFEHIASREQELKIHVKVRSGLVNLTRHGWLSVMTQGGTKVMGWLAKKGLRGPAAVATALGKLKN